MSRENVARLFRYIVNSEQDIGVQSHATSAGRSYIRYGGVGSATYEQIEAEVAKFLLSEPPDRLVLVRGFRIRTGLQVSGKVLVRIHSTPEEVAEFLQTRLKMVLLESQVENLRLQLNSLAATVRQLTSKGIKRTRESVSDFQKPAARIAQLALNELKTRTESMFGGEVTIEKEYDLDDQEAEYIVFCVSVQGEPKELVEKRCEWHQQVRELYPDSFASMRLLLVPNDGA